MSTFLESFLGSAIGALVVLAIAGLAVYLLRVWIGERIRQSVAHDFNLDLESYKNEISQLSAQLNAVQSTANAATVEGQRVAAEWRIDAANKLWASVLKVRNEAPTIITVLDIMRPSEYQRLITDSKFRGLVEELERFVNLPRPDVEQVRPFLGEPLYSLFFMYRAVNGRIALMLESGIKNKQVAPWHHDPGIRQQLNTVLTKEQLEVFDTSSQLPVSWMQGIVEEKILDGLREVIEGKVATTEALDQARKTIEVVQKIQAQEAVD